MVATHLGVVTAEVDLERSTDGKVCTRLGLEFRSLLPDWACPLGGSIIRFI